MTGNNPLRVLEIAVDPSVAYCGKLLADLGATVVTVEPSSGMALRRQPPLWLAGDGTVGSTAFGYLTAQKKLISVNTDHESGRWVVRRLTELSDVVLIGDAKEAAAEVSWLDSSELVDKGSIIGRVSLAGRCGPYRDLRGSEFQALALGGLLNVVGDEDREPLRLGGMQATYSAGLSLLFGVTAADWRRRSTGTGAEVTVSLMETVAYMDWKSSAYFQSAHHPIKRGTDPGTAVLPCADGFIGFYYQQHEWPIVVGLVGDARLKEPRFATEEERGRNKGELLDILAEFTKSRRKQDLFRACQDEGLAVGYVASLGDLLADPQYQARDFVSWDLPASRDVPVAVPRTPWTFDGRREPARFEVGAVGRDNIEVLTGRLGFDADQVKTLAGTGAI